MNVIGDLWPAYSFMSIRVRYSTGQEAHLTVEEAYRAIEQLKVDDVLAMIFGSIVQFYRARADGSYLRYCNMDFGSSALSVPAKKLKADIDVLVLINSMYPPLEYST